MKDRKEVLLPCLGVIVAAVLLMLGMLAVQPGLIAAAEQNQFLFPFWPSWLEGAMEGSFFYRVMWLLGDMTEAQFLKSVPASLFMFAVALIAFGLEKRKSKYAGTGVGGNCGAFLQIIIAQVLGLVLCQLVYGGFFKIAGWIPTFTPMCSVAPALILTFGKDVKKVATSIVMAALVPFPIAYFIMRCMTDPVGLPGFVAGAFGMAIGTVVATELCRLMPWMKKGEDELEKPPLDAEAASTCEETPAPAAPISGTRLFFRRLFADSNELVFWGSSLAGVAMYVGAAVSWLLNPLHPSYSSGNFPIMLCAQLCTTALAFFLWYPRYKKNGFAFTFPCIVLTAAIVNTYPPVWQIVVPTIIVSAVVLPFMVEWILGFIKYDGRWHVCVFALASIATCCLFWSFFVMNVLMPVFSPVVA